MADLAGRPDLDPEDPQASAASSVIASSMELNERREWVEAQRTRQLLDAQAKAAALFDEVSALDILRPGATDHEASAAIGQLAAERFGVERHWHKRIVRSGPNTQRPYQDNPPDRTMDEDDIVFADFGPVFGEWEADFGRTWVLGDDPTKRRLCADLADIFSAGKACFDNDLDLTGEALYLEIVRLSSERGWTLGNFHCGHLVGEFPHQLLAGDRSNSMIVRGNQNVLRRTDPSGRVGHWILEIHLVDEEHGFGGFYEQLLTIAERPPI